MCYNYKILLYAYTKIVLHGNCQVGKTTLIPDFAGTYAHAIVAQSGETSGPPLFR
jgi:hypothetical protein